ncbi:hypothetical protein MMC20_008092 [Loxospora ochrophaea]|nr:hypothetical protein [Loxospora ochrophaea]
MSWTIYSVGQNLVLYSRLHLVSPNYRIQRGILIMILSTLLTVQVPCWIFVWGAYDPDPKISSVWSPRMAIQERYQQLAYTCVETTISGFYIYSLIKLLRLKTSVRQRRVMRDLILVNVIVISFDIVLILLMYLNQLGLSHPIQAFSYMLKLKLEFAVLNQLMAVAARGLRRTNFEEKRYHHSSTEDSMWTVSPHDSGRKPPIFLQHSNSPAEVSKPSVAHLKKGLSFDDQSGYDGPSDPPEINNNSLSEPGQTTNPSEGRYLSISTGSTLENAQHTSRERLPESSEKFPAEEASRIARWIKIMRRRQASAASKKRPARRAPGDLDDDDEDDIGVYMWEHRGSLVLRAPWFGSEDSELHA